MVRACIRIPQSVSPAPTIKAVNILGTLIFQMMVSVLSPQDTGYISLYDLAEMVRSEGIDTIVIPSSRNDTEESVAFSDAGFEYAGDRGGYSVYLIRGEEG